MNPNDRYVLTEMLQVVMHDAREIISLRGKRIVGVERMFGFAMSQEIDRQRRVSGCRERRRETAPEKRAGAEAVQEDHWRPSAPDTLHMQRAHTTWNSQMLGVHAAIGQDRGGFGRSQPEASLVACRWPTS